MSGFEFNDRVHVPAENRTGRVLYANGEHIVVHFAGETAAYKPSQLRRAK
jgi:hypothetical protein